MSPLRFVFPVLVFLSSPASAVVLDSFTSPLPPNPLLPSGRPVLFLGPFCDGAACPPDSIVENLDGFSEANQSGIPTVPMGARYASLRTEAEDPALDHSRLEITGGALHVDVAGANPAEFQCVYGGPQEKLGLDLPAEGGDRFELVLTSDAASFSPVDVQMNCYTIIGDGTSSFLAQATATVSAPGTIPFPYSSFTVYPGASLHQVDEVFVYVTGVAGGTSIRVEELRTAAVPTPARGSTWGRVKATYR